MLVLLLLGAGVCMGLSEHEELFGSAYSFQLHQRVQTLEFSPKYSNNVITLWTRDEPDTVGDRRHRVDGVYYELPHLTPKDNGVYTMRDRYKRPLFTKSIEVRAKTESYIASPGEDLSFSSNLERGSCYIYFFPESYRQKPMMEIVSRGTLQDDGLNGGKCARFQLLRPCGIQIENVHVSCGGRFEFRDGDGNMAMELSLELKSSNPEPSYLGIAVGIFFVTFCCCCVRRYCCGSSVTKDDSRGTGTSPAPAGERYQECDNEPVRPQRSRQPSPSRYPAHPPHTQRSPLVHKGNYYVPPPSFAKVVTPAKQDNAPMDVLNADSEPRFELKGMTFPMASPLSSESTQCDVYTSDKLNFL